MPIESPYNERIARLKQKIRRKPGQNPGMKNRLQGLKYDRYQQQQAQPVSQPFNARYDTSMAGLGRDRDLATSNLDYNQQRVTQDYGFDDPSNPFSRAALLERTYQQQRSGTLNSYAGAGQLYSGALTRARDADRFNYEQGRGALRGSYDETLRDLAVRRLEAQNTYQSGAEGAEAQRLEDSINERPEPGSVPKPPKKPLPRKQVETKPVSRKQLGRIKDKLKDRKRRR